MLSVCRGCFFFIFCLFFLLFFFPSHRPPYQLSLPFSFLTSHIFFSSLHSLPFTPFLLYSPSASILQTFLPSYSSLFHISLYPLCCYVLLLFYSSNETISTTFTSYTLHPASLTYTVTGTQKQKQFYTQTREQYPRKQLQQYENIKHHT